MYLIEIIIIEIWKMLAPGYKFKGDCLSWQWRTLYILPTGHIFF